MAFQHRPSGEDVCSKVWAALVRDLGTEAAYSFVLEYFRDSNAFFSRIGQGGRAPVPQPAAAQQGNSGHAASFRSETPSKNTISPPTTRLPQQDIQKIISKTWMKTGFEIEAYPPGEKPWKIPLNYQVITIGCSGARRNDIELNYPEIANQQARLSFQEDRFVVFNENPLGNTRVNGEVINSRELKDADTIQVGSVSLRIFRLLDIVCEMTAVSGPHIGTRWILDKSEILIGRSGARHNDLELEDKSVSRQHARLNFHQDHFLLSPEAPTNPTFVNGEWITSPRELNDNDQIIIGTNTLCFRMQSKKPKPQTLLPKYVTILFSDLRGYTSLAESNPLKELIAQLNEYLQAMSEVIHTQGGTVITYQGDAIMALFGAPTRHADDPLRAIVAALEMQKGLSRLNERWEREGRPAFMAGIGISTGMSMVGDVGFAERREYTALGDTVNLAARLEQMTKEHKVLIIMSDTTYAETQSQVESRSLGLVQVKGKANPVQVYEVVGLKPEYSAQNAR
ncbi:MAG: FHA domain-containing protein [Candidatus Xenobia bacterium]